MPHKHATVLLVALQKSNRVGVPPFPLGGLSQNGPRCQGFATPRRNGAPLTAPGRSEETLPDKRKRRVGKLMTPASKHLAHARAIRLEAPAQRQGAGCRDFSRLPARGEAFSLDILFYRTGRLLARILSEEGDVSRLRDSLGASGLHKSNIYWRKRAILPRGGLSPKWQRRRSLARTGSPSPFPSEVSQYLYRVPGFTEVRPL